MAGLPPTLLISEENDPLRDEVKNYARRLVGGGVDVYEVLLAGITGWPCVLGLSQAARTDWLNALIGYLRTFLHPANCAA
jgi:acetyl esterase/lipase